MHLVTKQVYRNEKLHDIHFNCVIEYIFIQK